MKTQQPNTNPERGEVAAAKEALNYRRRMMEDCIRSVIGQRYFACTTNDLPLVFECGTDRTVGGNQTSGEATAVAMEGKP